jgi:hypothetical protein
MEELDNGLSEEEVEFTLEVLEELVEPLIQLRGFTFLVLTNLLLQVS